MDDNPTVDPHRAYVGSKIARYEKVVVRVPDRRGRMRKRITWRKVKDGWGPFEAINYAADREAVETYRLCSMLAQLCSDEKARALPDHGLIHLLSGVQGCVGPSFLAETARSLGISDERARYLEAQLDAEWAATQGLIGG